MVDGDQASRVGAEIEDNAAAPGSARGSPAARSHTDVAASRSTLRKVINSKCSELVLDRECALSCVVITDVAGSYFTFCDPPHEEGPITELLDRDGHGVTSTASSNDPNSGLWQEIRKDRVVRRRWSEDDSGEPATRHSAKDKAPDAMSLPQHGSCHGSDSRHTELPLKVPFLLVGPWPSLPQS